MQNDDCKLPTVGTTCPHPKRHSDWCISIAAYLLIFLFTNWNSGGNPLKPIAVTSTTSKAFRWIFLFTANSGHSRGYPITHFLRCTNEPLRLVSENCLRFPIFQHVFSDDPHTHAADGFWFNQQSRHYLNFLLVPKRDYSLGYASMPFFKSIPGQSG